MHEAQRWLEWLYGTRPDGLIWIGGHGDRFAGRTFTSIPDAVAYAEQLDQGGAGGVYHRLTTLRPIGQGRGTAADSAYLPGFAMDLDLRGPGHKALNYPETEQELVTLLRKAGLPEPSAWVHSGGGRYPFWKLEQPADLTLPHELERAAEISARLHKLVIGWAGEAGWKVDNTSDLARVYRLPGTHNRKGDEPVMARVLWDRADATSMYSLDGMHTAVWTAPRPEIERPRAAEPDPFTSASQLFSVSEAPRVYSVSEAMTYVQPALEALRTAQDGEINNRLNDAAMMMAHFGEEFWSREAAERQLLAALAETVYDGGTWQAEVTISSAYNAIAVKSGGDYWRAQLRPGLAEAIKATEPDAVDALLAEMVRPSELRERPPQPYLVKGLLNIASETWLIGAPGSRKSFVALDLAAHVAEGRDWLGRKVRQGPVVIIAAEGAGGLGSRIKAWEAEHGRPMSDQVHILPRPVQAASPVAWGVLVKACERIGPALVIGDTQARLSVGLKENDATDMGIYIAAIGAIKMASGACVVSIHHTGRSGGDARGSSALDGAQDTELKVTAGTEPLRGELHVEKQKDLTEGPAIPLLFGLHVVGQDEDGDPVTSLALRSWDAFEAASGVTVEVEPWEAGHAEVIVHLFKVLRDQGAEGGLTKAEAKHAVIERGYGGDAKRLTKSTWYSGWDRALAKRSASGDPVMVNIRGEKWTVDPVALADLGPREL